MNRTAFVTGTSGGLGQAIAIALAREGYDLALTEIDPTQLKETLTHPDVAKRNGMIREALIRTRDEMLVIPLHHQVRPWAMKQNVTTVHRSDDRPEARFTTIR